MMLLQSLPERDPPRWIRRVPLVDEREVRVRPVREEAGGEPQRRPGLIQLLRLAQSRHGSRPVRAGRDIPGRRTPRSGSSGSPDHGALIEGFPEDRLGVAPQLDSRLLSRAQRGRGPDADQVPLRRAEPVLQPPQQQGEVRALRPVEGVHLVDHQEAQRLRVVLLPERLVPAAQEQVVEHLVVREQDVGRVLPHRLAMGDDAVRGHLVGRVLRLRVRVDPGPHPLERADLRDRRRDPARLVGRQRVHRVDQDRLDPGLSLVPPAVVEDRPEVGLRLARARCRWPRGSSACVSPPSRAKASV